jgi:hypothetical protein
MRRSHPRNTRLGPAAHMRRKSSSSLEGLRKYSTGLGTTDESPHHRSFDRPACRRGGSLQIPEVDCDRRPGRAIIAQTVLRGLPYPFRILVSSRPEGHINRTFDTNKWIKQIPVQKYDLSKDSHASKDIRTFLQQEFDKLFENHNIDRQEPRLPFRE